MIRFIILIIALVATGSFRDLALSQEPAASSASSAQSEKKLLADQAKIEADFKEKTGLIDSETKKLAGASTLFEGESPPDSSTSISNAEGKAALVKASLGKVRAEVDAHRDEEQRRLDRVSEIPQLIENLNADKAKDSVANGTAAGDNALVDQKIATLQAELGYYRSAAGLLAAKGVYLVKRFAVIEGANTAWQGLVDNQRIVDAKEAEESAKATANAIKDDPETEAIAKETAKLAEESRVFTQKLIQANEDLTSLNVLSETISEQYANAQRRVNLLRDANLPIDPTTGRLLRAQRKDLPSPTGLRNRLRESLKDAAQMQLDLFERESELTRIVVEENEMGGAVEAARGKYIQQLRTVNKDSRDYLIALAELAGKFRSLSLETGAFAEFIDERLLWIQSSAPFSLSDLDEEKEAIGALVQSNPAGSIAKRCARSPLMLVAVLLAIGVLFYRLPVHHRILAEQGRMASRRKCYFIRPTVVSLLMTALISLPISLLAWFVFSRSGDTSEGVSLGLRYVSVFLTVGLFFLALTLPGGILVKHFRISDSKVALLRRHFRWFVFVMPPLILLSAALPIDSPALDAAGRVFFILLVAGPMVFFLRVLNPSRGLVQWHGEPSIRLAWTCFVLGLLTPSLLIIGAVSGFYASAQQLGVQLLLSLLIILATLFFTALLRRWILVSRRRMVAMEQGIPVTSELSEEDEERSEKEEAVKIEEQILRLLRVAGLTLAVIGLWGVWLPSLPALAVLDQVELWKDSSPSLAPVNPISAVSPLAGVANLDAPIAQAVGTNDDGVVSLQDLFFAILTLVLTLVAANNIPGLIALVFLRHFKLEAGSSFALTTTIRYSIMFVGFLIAFGWIDVTWGKVQWLAAAVTVGIGFGLQEIFANFVAGLILLFEKPIRIGDTVTVGDVSGKVTQIRIRATTIRQFNHRELVVPNKEFITGQLVNWTLSDSVLRVEVLVGIAYGSDTERTRQILLAVAAEDEAILVDPEPEVFFTAFGDSTLNFELRAQVGSVDDLLVTKSRLHFEVDKRFRAAGIEIAFPQRDIHIRSGLSQPEGQSSPEGNGKKLEA